MASVTAREKAARSTDSEPPAGTAFSSAHATQRLPNRFISAFIRPAAEPTRFALKELEQMSSAKSGDLWAGEKRTGFIS